MAEFAPIELKNFNQGGIADSKFSGIEDSMYKLIGYDPHSSPGLLKVAQKLTKDTSTTITAFCKVAVNSSNGAQYWFSSTDGKIWECTSGGTWRLVHTTTAAAGGHSCLGAAEYQGYIYWATESRLHRITVGNADDNDWVTDAVEDWATFGVTDASFHPMTQVNLVLYIGDGNQVAQVDAGTFSANALDIATPLRIKALGTVGTDLLIGTYVADTVTSTHVLNWNTWSSSFNYSDPIPENGINAFLPGDNIVFVQAGVKGNIYVYTNGYMELYRTIPGDYSPTATGSVHPYSAANMNGQVLFGFSNVTGNPADELVYRLGRNSKNYPWILDQPYPISERSSGEFVLSGIEIGAILVVGDDLFVAWKNSTTYGVDQLDYSNKLDGAYFESRVFVVDRSQLTNFSKAVAAYFSLPASTDIDFYLSKNAGAYGSALSTIDDVDRLLIETDDEADEFITLQVKVKMTASVNTAPNLEKVMIYVN